MDPSTAAAQAAATAQATSILDPAVWLLPQIIMMALASILSIASLFVALQAKAESRDAKRADWTRDYITKFNSPSLRSKYDFVTKDLARHAIDNGCASMCGLTALNVGKPIKIKTDNGGVVSMGAGDVARDVLTFFDTIARDVRKNRLDDDLILDTMAPAISSAWRSLFPHMRHRTFGDYYAYFKAKWSIGSLARIIDEHSTNRKRLAAIKRRWHRFPW